MYSQIDSTMQLERAKVWWGQEEDCYDDTDLDPQMIEDLRQGRVWRSFCQATVTVSVCLNGGTDRLLVTFSSGGLYDIWSPVGPGYKQEVEDDQIQEAIQICARFGVKLNPHEFERV